MMANEIGRLAHAINNLRPDWPIASLRTFITNQLGQRTYRDAAVALTWVAVDQKPDGTNASETPKRVLEAGPWWQAASTGGNGGRHGPPKRHEQCEFHPGSFADFCAGCRADQLAGDQPPRPGVGDAASGVAAVRAALVAAVSTKEEA